MSWSGDSSLSKVINLLNAIVLIGGIVWIAAFLRADVDKNTEQNKKQDQRIEYFQKQVRETYVRQDVLGPQIQQMRKQLDRIEEKLDD